MLVLHYLTSRLGLFVAAFVIFFLLCLKKLENRRETIATGAAEGGHLEVLQWARANGCPWDEYTCSYAARGGHLEVLKWARTNGCPWDDRICTNAAAGCHLELLQWAISNGCPYNRDLLCMMPRVKEWLAAGVLKL